MDHASPSAPVIVGIDGSTAALRAALWAIDEAVSRDTPIRLVHVAPASGHDLDEALADAKDVLHKAWTEVEANGKPVKIAHGRTNRRRGGTPARRAGLGTLTPHRPCECAVPAPVHLSTERGARNSARRHSSMTGYTLPIDGHLIDYI
jgi:hypothetical protein